jgi:hypothetical protein
VVSVRQANERDTTKDLNIDPPWGKKAPTVAPNKSMVRREFFCYEIRTNLMKNAAAVGRFRSAFELLARHQCGAVVGTIGVGSAS